MRIVVLAGGLSMERNVSLSSGNKICRALRARGHQAILVDMFMGFEDYDGKLEDVFDAPNGFCGDYSVAEAEPDLAAVRASRKDQSKSLFGPGVLDVCAKADVVFLALHVRRGWPRAGGVRPARHSVHRRRLLIERHCNG